MKTIFLSLCLALFTTTVFGESIYSKTQTISLGNCIVYHTTFWGDNGTQIVNDDRYLGFHDVLDCSQGINVPEELDKVEYYPDGSFRIPSGIKMIPYEEYQHRFLINQYKLGNLKVSEIPNEDPRLPPVQLKEFKN